ISGNPHACYVVARLCDHEPSPVVGYAGMWLVADEAHITNIAVHPDYRGRHVGERLLVSLLDTALQRGARHVTLEVRRGNLVAQGLYQKYRFQAVAVRRRYYSDTGEDAIVMWIEDLRDSEFQRVFLANKRGLEDEGAPSGD
ncbi:MAG: ribosomal protein S18-alanine N-acetyltransferase, partial [Armatimonadota bacterium]|nr:ribosomal protein S18-alanine N-acetyltransferase [Armatimonadota bacterium]